ncbi:Ribosomal silencing factor RsfS [uncultured Desulfobacterium sp.]|uniref:Ribosomal silencing factor RsfS n=1 Tax=uncultured Desulfobacterium sp. TaxID=201089 RepID=A0A445N1G7_9BACT|nr:Ribosomal silencing factor RsfS [uncultured Desulfobacterium sp.]
MLALDKSKLCLKIIQERKAIDPVVLEIGGLTTIADYFLIASGSSSRQVQAISRHLDRRMREEGFKPYGVEGEQEGHWVLIDYGDVIVHLFYQPYREYYDLEGLWVEAPRLSSKGTVPEENADEDQ